MEIDRFWINFESIWYRQLVSYMMAWQFAVHFTIHEFNLASSFKWDFSLIAILEGDYPNKKEIEVILEEDDLDLQTIKLNKQKG